MRFIDLIIAMLLGLTVAYGQTGEVSGKVLDKDDNPVVKKVIPFGITVDERIADGFYFAKSFKIFRHLIENPELLDRPLHEDIDFKV